MLNSETAAQQLLKGILRHLLLGEALRGTPLQFVHSLPELLEPMIKVIFHFQIWYNMTAPSRRNVLD